MSNFHLYQPVRVVKCIYPQLVGMETILTAFHPDVVIDSARGLSEPGWCSTIPHPAPNMLGAGDYAWFGESQIEPIQYKPSEDEQEELETEPEEELVFVEALKSLNKKVKSW